MPHVICWFPFFTCSLKSPSSGVFQLNVCKRLAQGELTLQKCVVPCTPVTQAPTVCLLFSHSEAEKRAIWAHGKCQGSRVPWFYLELQALQQKWLMLAPLLQGLCPLSITSKAQLLQPYLNNRFMSKSII